MGDEMLRTQELTARKDEPQADVHWREHKLRTAVVSPRGQQNRTEHIRTEQNIHRIVAMPKSFSTAVLSKEIKKEK